MSAKISPVRRVFSNASSAALAFSGSTSLSILALAASIFLAFAGSVASTYFMARAMDDSITLMPFCRPVFSEA